MPSRSKHSRCGCTTAATVSPSGSGDLNAPLRKGFKGLNFFPVDPAFRVTAKFTPYAEPKKIEMLNILGDIEPFESPGTVAFELRGETITMEPLLRPRRPPFGSSSATGPAARRSTRPRGS